MPPIPDDRKAAASTMADVARIAGVSQMTVSRAINDTGPVSEATRQRIQTAMAQLDYRPNAAARALATGRSGMIGVVAVESGHIGPSSMLFAIQEAARAEDWNVSVVGLRSDGLETIGNAIERLRDQQVDGVVVMTPKLTDDEVLAQLEFEVPMVRVHARPDDSLPKVIVDQIGGASAAVEHLLSRGHSTVHHLGGPVQWGEALDRRKAWEDTLVAHGADVPEVLVGDWSATSGYEQGRVLLEAEPTAVFVANDQMALGLYRAAHERGLAVGRDLHVAGFDDVPEAEHYLPGLTTVQQDFDEIGRRSVHNLRALVTGDAPPAGELVPAPLVVRASTVVSA